MFKNKLALAAISEKEDQEREASIHIKFGPTGEVKEENQNEPMSKTTIMEDEVQINKNRAHTPQLKISRLYSREDVNIDDSNRFTVEFANRYDKIFEVLEPNSPIFSPRNFSTKSARKI